MPWHIADDSLCAPKARYRIAQRVPVARRGRDRPGSWDVTGLRGTGSFDWTAEDVFLAERRTMPQLGVPLENQWARWPCAGIDALIELAGGKTPRGRTGALLCENPQVRMRSGGPTPS